jgi:hypothetical protein
MTKQKLTGGFGLFLFVLLFAFISVNSLTVFADSDSISVSFSVYNSGQTNSSLNLVANQSTTINATNATNAYFTFTTSSNVTNGSISFYYANDNIKGTNGTSSLTSFEKFVDIQPSSSINASFSNGTIRIYYSSSDLVYDDDEVFVESSLKLYHWNSTSANWTAEPTQGIDTDNNYVWATINHLSLFGIFGSKVELSDDDAPENIGGSGGGGGGYSCSEDWLCDSWKECKDGFEARICYDFNNCGTTAKKPIVKQSCGTAAAQLQEALLAPMPAPTAATTGATSVAKKIVPLSTSIAVLAVMLALILIVLYATSKRHKHH